MADFCGLRVPAGITLLLSILVIVSAITETFETLEEIMKMHPFLAFSDIILSRLLGIVPAPNPATTIPFESFFPVF